MAGAFSSAFSSAFDTSISICVALTDDASGIRLSLVDASSSRLALTVDDSRTRILAVSLPTLPT